MNVHKIYLGIFTKCGYWELFHQDLSLKIWVHVYNIDCILNNFGGETTPTSINHFV